jgi:hypothetical protein
LENLALALLLGALGFALVLSVLAAPEILATLRLVSALEAQPPLDAAALRAVPPGALLAFEGTVAAGTPARWKTLVEYEFTHYQSTLYEVKEAHRVVAPPLWIDLSGGQAQLVEGYAIEDAPRYYNMSLMENRGSDVYGGFEIGSRVSIIGTGAGAPGGKPVVRAQIVTGKTVAEFLQERRQWLATLPVLDAVLSVLALSAVGARVAARR